MPRFGSATAKAWCSPPPGLGGKLLLADPPAEQLEAVYEDNWGDRSEARPWWPSRPVCP
jgi:hypothetical protein